MPCAAYYLGQIWPEKLEIDPMGAQGDEHHYHCGHLMTPSQLHYYPYPYKRCTGVGRYILRDV